MGAGCVSPTFSLCHYHVSSPLLRVDLPPMSSILGYSSPVLSIHLRIGVSFSGCNRAISDTLSVFSLTLYSDARMPSLGDGPCPAIVMHACLLWWMVLDPLSRCTHAFFGGWSLTPYRDARMPSLVDGPCPFSTNARPTLNSSSPLN